MKNTLLVQMAGVTAVVVLATSGLVAGQRGSAAAGNKLHVQYINVGQADATLITDDNGCRILIDSADTRYPGSQTQFKTYLQKAIPGGSSIDLAVASHPHADHIGGMKWVLQTYKVKTFVDDGETYASSLYTNLMSTVKAQQKQSLGYFAFGDFPSAREAVCGAGGPKVHTLYPKSGFQQSTCDANPNDCSVAVTVTFGDTVFLFPGDAEEEEETELVKDATIKPQLAATVLKVPHHGSDTSSSADFLAAIHPDIMVISAGAKDTGTNKGYKHPRLSTVEHLLKYAGPKTNARAIDVYDADQKKWTQATIYGSLYETNKDGDVNLESDGKNVTKK